MKILLPSVLPSVFPKSDQETAAQQHLRRQEKKEEKSCEKRAVLIREGQLEKSNLEKENFTRTKIISYCIPDHDLSVYIHSCLRIIAYLGVRGRVN